MFDIQKLFLALAQTCAASQNRCQLVVIRVHQGVGNGKLKDRACLPLCLLP